MPRETVDELKKRIYEAAAEENVSLDEVRDALEAANEFLQENPELLIQARILLRTLGLLK
ncbi:MAG: hypothetical protein WC441_05175 [Patescibacteria group bacterium]|jgi:hypothetical protein